MRTAILAVSLLVLSACGGSGVDASKPRPFRVEVNGVIIEGKVKVGSSLTVRDAKVTSNTVLRSGAPK